MCCKCSFCHRVATKERCKSQLLLQSHRNKICERCFLCRSLEFFKYCHKCPNCCKSTCRGKVTSVLGEVGSSGFESKSSHNTQRGLHPPLPVQTQSNQVTNCHKQLCQPTKTVQPFGGTVSADEQKCSGTGGKPKLNGFLQPAIFGTQTPETIRTSLQLGEWVTSIDFKDTYFHIPIHSQSRKYMHFHIQGQSYQFKALPFGLSTAPMEFTVVAKEVKLMALQRGIRIHQYLDDWLVRATSHQTCLQHTQTLVVLCQELGWLVNKEKSELDPKQVFNFVGYQFDLREGKFRPTPERWQTLTDKILSILSGPVCQFMTLVGLLTATEKQVHLGRLHMRPIQWHLKNNWRVPESLEKVIPVPRSLHPNLRWWLEESNVLLGQPLHPLKHALQIFTDASKEGLGRSLKRTHCKGNLVPSRKLVAHKSLGTKGGLSGSKTVPRPLFKQHSPGSHRQHNSGCLYQQRRGDEVGLPVCPTGENPILVHQETGNPQGTSHLQLAERDSRQAIQTWPDHSNRVVPSPRSVSSYMLQVAPAPSGLVCHQIQQQTPAVCVTSSRPPGLGSGCTQPVFGKSGSICLPTRAAILGKVVEKLQDYPCNRIILIASGWPNMPWFGDLVAMSSQIPLCLPNLPSLVSQPFNLTLHRNLSNLNLHAWVLEPQQSRSRDALRQWQHELRLLKEDQPDASVRQSGPFLQSGASVIRWILGHHL